MRRSLVFLVTAALLLAWTACSDDGDGGGAAGAGGGAGAGASGGGGGGGSGGQAAAPVVTAVEPPAGVGGDLVTVLGTGFADGCTVFVGTAAAPGVAFESAQRLGVTVPALSANGAVDVTVRNPDGQSGRLRGGFQYGGGPGGSGGGGAGGGGGSGGTAIDWAILQYPPSHTGAPGSSLDVYARVYEAGVTEPAGQGAGIEAQLGAGRDGQPPESWTWQAATFNVDVDGANDEYRGTLLLAETGSFRFTMRFRREGGAWLVADLTGSDDGFDPTATGTLEVTGAQAQAVDWCILQWPPAMTAAAGQATELAYGRVFEAGVTGEGASGPTPRSELGFGPRGSDPGAGGWSWAPGAFNVFADNGFGAWTNDEHQASLTAPAAGEYDYAWRFSLDGSAWTYCDTDGTDNGYDPAAAGHLVVQ